MKRSNLQNQIVIIFCMFGLLLVAGCFDFRQKSLAEGFAQNFEMRLFEESFDPDFPGPVWQSSSQSYSPISVCGY